MERVTATIDKQTLTAIRRVAGKRGVSAFLQVAARERLARMRLLSLLDELDAEHGAPSAELQAEVDADARRIFAMEKRAGAVAAPRRAKARRR
jgi:hypothetical protein